MSTLNHLDATGDFQSENIKDNTIVFPEDKSNSRYIVATVEEPSEFLIIQDKKVWKTFNSQRVSEFKAEVRREAEYLEGCFKAIQEGEDPFQAGTSHVNELREIVNSMAEEERLPDLGTINAYINYAMQLTNLTEQYIVPITRLSRSLTLDYPKVLEFNGIQFKADYLLSYETDELLEILIEEAEDFGREIDKAQAHILDILWDLKDEVNERESIRRSIEMRAMLSDNEDEES